MPSLDLLRGLNGQTSEFKLTSIFNFHRFDFDLLTGSGAGSDF